MKYDIPLLDYDTRFSLWQVKMRAVLSQADLDDALDKFGNKDSKSWSDEEKRRDRKAFRDTLTLNDVCEALQAKEKMKQMVSSDGSASNGEALAARGRTEKKSNNGSRAFKEWKVMIENQTEKKVKILRTDNGMEFCSDQFKAYCKSQGIVRHYTIPHTPQQNGVAERMNRTIISRARCMLSNAGLNKRFWAEAASTACYLINRSPSITLDKKTPIEVWSGSPADYSQLRVFGCTAYAHFDNGKLEPRAIKCIFLGYQSGVKGYKLWNPQTQKVVLSRNVIFNETAMLSDNLSSDAPIEGQQKSSVQVEHFIDVDNTPENDNDAVQDVHIPDNSPIVDDSSSVEHSSPVVQPPQHSIAADRSVRTRKPTRRLIEECNVAYALNIAEEIEVKLPIDKKSVRCKWIFKRKEGIFPSEPARFKARLVAKGYSQIPGIDFNDIFSPVVKHSSIRMLLSLVAMHDYELEQLDVKTAFLHGELDETIYMRKPCLQIKEISLWIEAIS
ncbi:hypothetical protein U9M48_037728 [Paspalum notatum var. saurae]|uniref:Integrase catalytic domain-containing protein n=1 Tax=Paspalum notatum var. saurae TaxID=547442 RepID=A0AAQ3UKG0_PASNO